MDASDPDVAARGRALFEQLRAEREGEVGSGPSAVGSPLRSTQEHVGPLRTHDSQAPLVGNHVGAEPEPAGAAAAAEVQAGASHQPSVDRASEDSRAGDGRRGDSSPAPVGMAADLDPAPAASSGGEQADPVPGSEQAAPAAGSEQAAPAAGSEQAAPAAGPDAAGTRAGSEQAVPAAAPEAATTAGLEQAGTWADSERGDVAAGPVQPAGGTAAPPRSESDDPATAGGSRDEDRPSVATTPATATDGRTADASPPPPSGANVYAAAPEAGGSAAGAAPPAPAVAGSDTFHVEHDASDAPAAVAPAAEPAVPAEHESAPPVTPPPPPAGEGRARHPAADLALPRIIAVANQKGGVGKTTTAVNLGAALAELGFRTLVVDLDPQGNATTGLGINARNLDSSIYDVLMHEMPIDECIEPTSVRNLFVAPATIDLAGAEIELVPAFSRELRLKRALAEVADAYEFTIIDCPPSLGLLTVNGLAAATEVIVPIQCEYYALEGLGQLMRNVNLVQSNLNPSLLLSAIILTMYDARTKLADQVATEVRDHFGTRVCRNVVPRTVRLSEAPSFGQPIIVFDPSSRGALAYRELAKEVSGGAPQRVG